MLLSQTSLIKDFQLPCLLTNLLILIYSYSEIIYQQKLQKSLLHKKNMFNCYIFRGNFYLTNKLQINTSYIIVHQLLIID